MRIRLFCSSLWRISVPWVFFVLMLPNHAVAGRNAGGALIVHTNDQVNYTSSGQYCGLNFDDPGSCEAAGTRTDKDENTPAVIWFLAAFPDTSSPAVTTIQFGIDHNIPPGEGYFDGYGMCGSLELPDNGWPETGHGNLVSFGSTVESDLLFPFYWLAAYGFTGAYLGTTVYPSTDEAKFVDDSTPAEEELIALFGTVRWGAPGLNECPGHSNDGGGDNAPDEDEQPDGAEGQDDDRAGRTFYASTSQGNTLFVDPADNDAIQLSFVHAAGIPPTNLTVTVREAKTSYLVYQTTISVGEAPVTLPSLPLPYFKGMAKVTLDVTSGDGNLYEVWATSHGDGTDHILINHADLGLKSAGLYVFPFFCPTSATRIRLSALDHPSPPARELFELRNPDGDYVLVDYTGAVYEIDVPERDRGGLWRLYIYSSGHQYDQPHGSLGVEFLEYGATAQEWWRPQFALALNAADPPRAQFGPHELTRYPDWETWFTPTPRPYRESSPYVEGQTPPCNQRLVWRGRQEFCLGSWPDVESRFTIRNCAGVSDPPMKIEIWSNGGEREFLSLEGLQSVSRTFGGTPTEERKYIRVVSTEAVFDIQTDAPMAVVGPTPGFRWWKKCPTQSDLSSPECWFYVPVGLSNVCLTIDASRVCNDQERGNRDYKFRVYPPVNLVVTDPSGSATMVTANEENGGTAGVTIPVEADRAGLWRYRVDVPGADAGNSSGLDIFVTLGEDLPPYLTWLEPQRFMLPVTVPGIPRMVHTTDVPFTTPWMIVPPADVYFCRAQVYHVGGEYGPAARSPIPLTIGKTLVISGDANKEVQRTGVWPWASMAGSTWPEVSIKGVDEAFYALRRPVGLTVDGDLRNSDYSIPGTPDRFIGLSGPMSMWGCYAYVPPPQDCYAQLEQGLGRDFRAFGSGLNNVPEWLRAHNAIGLASETRGLGLDSYIDQTDLSAFESFLEERQPGIRNGILCLGYGGEPLMVEGYDIAGLREAAYIIRKYDARHPIAMNEEPTLVNLREMGDLPEIWFEDEYIIRGKNGSPPAVPLCDFATRTLAISRDGHPERAVGMSQLAAFVEDGLYGRAGPDTAAAQMFTALLLGADVVGQFARYFNGYDLMVDHPRLWTAYGPEGILALGDSVRSWLTTEPPYDVTFLPSGESVIECPEPPVLTGYGPWYGDPGWLGTWFVLCNLGQEDAMEVELDWDQLHLPEGLMVEDVVDGQSLRFAQEGDVIVTQGASIWWRVPKAAWVIGRLIWQLHEADVIDSAESTTSGLQVRVLGHSAGQAKRFMVETPQATDLVVTVSDVAGRIVRRFPSRLVAAGQTEIIWDGADDRGRSLPGGIYFVRCTALGGGHRVARALLLR